MKRNTKFLRLTACLLTLALLISAIVTVSVLVAKVGDKAVESFISKYEGTLEDLGFDISDYFDGKVVQPLPDTVKDTDDISLIIKLDEAPLLDVYAKSDKEVSFTDYVISSEAQAIRDAIAAKKADILSDLDGARLSYLQGANYSAVLSGFEILIKAGDFEAVCDALPKNATPIVGEVYKAEDMGDVRGYEDINAWENKLVENAVDVYDTGIFDSSDFAYDGTGIVVAVLDTGLDYNHTAFSTSNFTADRSKLGMTFAEVASLVGGTKASQMQSGLTASDVYISEKVPFGFDYADGDADVYPISQDHGTHVAGVVAGKDDVITGVAPNAQLVIMKTFSDIQSTARSSWILSALEDCVVLGVDVINMSLGTGCGFSRETDKEQISGVYDRIRAAGISMVVAASNSFSSAYGSDKNGNLGLTSNPDTATVGSPGTYQGALSVASINGANTPYILYNGKILYFTESSDRVSEEKDFVEDLLKNVDTSKQNEDGTYTFEYVTIPGAGRNADYTGIDVSGKIVLVARGSTTFEEKANVAQAMGAAGIIIYNNVSGEIKMNVGDTTIAVCSIPQDDGEMMAEAGTGSITVGEKQSSGPFMSDFSSWGPTPDLQIKPEITAHGGSILSSIPGQEYDRISGTSMACPNMAGVVTLIRQYVKENFKDIADDNVKVAALVNRLLMSTADIVINSNGLPYSVRKQGAGLANLNATAATKAYIMTYDRKTGELMDKSKIELGDDPDKTGVYTLKFSVNNFGGSALSYNVGAWVMTEGVSDTKTNDGETTVTEQGYQLSGATVTVTAKNGTVDGTTLTVGANSVAEVEVIITLSDADKKYMDESFANGMYVEGFITLDSTDEGGIDLSVPYLGFYGDWSVAPIFDIDYYETNKDELDDSIDLLDKTLPDAYATRPVGGIESDFVGYLGSYYFEQDPASKKISADRKYISLSNQEGTIHSLRYVWAGLLRNAKSIVVTITDDATGEVIFSSVENDIRKSYGDGGSIYAANVEIEFDAAEYDLRNNSTYTVNLKANLDWDNDGTDTNLNNEFEFPFVADFQAPAVTGCEFYTEYDKTEKKERLYAKIAVYDNHYAMAMHVGYVGNTATGAVLNAFDHYLTPIYSEFNDTGYVIYELTDYVDEIRNNAINKNTFTVVAYDYALNVGTYEIELPDEYTDFYFEETELTLSPNQIYDLKPLVYPGTEWSQLLEFSTTKPAVATTVNNQLVAVAPGTCVVVARDPVTKKTATFPLTVLGEGDEGYVKYDKPVTNNFVLTGYYVDKAYYQLDSTQREIGSTGDERKFVGSNYSLSMYPSEAVSLRYKLDAYFPEHTKVMFESSNENIVKVDENGKITAVAEGFASIAVRVYMRQDSQSEYASTYYSQSINIEVKNPYITTGPSLTHYYGNGGLVHIPADLAITAIDQFAFSNFDYVEKGPGDEISEDDPTATKLWFLGDDTIEEVIIPEGVESIGAYAFANLTALKKVTLPSTLTKIDYGAFYGCTALMEVKGIETVKFINQNAFNGCALKGTISLDSATALSDYAFAGNTKLEKVILSEKTQSLGIGTFEGCTSLKSITIGADFIKLGKSVFSGCKALETITVNTAVVPAYAFNGCSALASVNLGKDVAVIGEYAFAGAPVSAFAVDAANTAVKVGGNGQYLLSADGTQLLAVSSAVQGELTIDSSVTSVETGAFSGNTSLISVSLPGVTVLGEYAFAGCTNLKSVTTGNLTAIGAYAFANTAITETPSFASLKEIGEAAFMGTRITSVTIPEGMTVGNRAFYECKDLSSVTIGKDAVIGNAAFALSANGNFEHANEKLNENDRIYYFVYTSPLTSLTIGDNVTLGREAFMGAAKLESLTLGSNVTIGNRAFYNAVSLKEIDLSKVTSIGSEAFSGDVLYMYADSAMNTPAVDAEGYHVYRYYAPALVSVDLSAVTKLGNDAFAYCRELTSVKLGGGLTEIADRAFMNCASLAEINLSHVTAVGDNAFAEAGLSEVNLPACTDIGIYAFYSNLGLTKVTLGEGVTVGEGAFSYSEKLAEVAGLSQVTSVGDYAFAFTALTDLDLTSATYIGTQAFLKEEVTDVTVKLGAALADLGDNPFAMCRVSAFMGEAVENFNGKDYIVLTDTYEISETVRVIGGSLYRVVPNGLELITFAPVEDQKTFTVAAGTTRVSEMACAGAEITYVILPDTLMAVGHKAFYACDKLATVAFSSYGAPVLEEAFDYEYFAVGQNLPGKGTYTYVLADGVTQVEYEGIEILPYFMWNATDLPTNIYYGANFMDYIGHVETPITVVRPVNGQNYDTFIMGQYFATFIDGAAAADDITKAFIKAVGLLPETVSLSDKPLVVAARAAYDLISTDEQRGLVTEEYAKLIEAEKRIANLEYLENGEETGEDFTSPGEAKDPDTLIRVLIVALSASALVIILLAVFLIAVMLRNGKAPKAKKAKKAKSPKAEAPVATPEEEISEEAASEEAASEEAPVVEETAENAENAETAEENND
ncbi:MAG: leucine-rich repeat protein [Clostridia bacterium]|nr:leucine-rich repeat protein [Clostridia bacterium]